MARAAADVRFARAYRSAVEVYAMQHVERFGVSAKSYAAHLTGLCCVVEHDADPGMLAAIARWLSGPSPVEKPAVLPPPRGRLTLDDAARAATPEAHAARVREWAADVWNAYREQHALARRWLEEAARSPARRH